MRLALACLMAATAIACDAAPPTSAPAASPSSSAIGSPQGGLAVGAPVVAAISKTSFRAGTVTALDDREVTLEYAAADAAGKPPSWTVAREHAWPLRPVTDARAGEPLVCRLAGAQSWSACRVIAATPDAVSIEDGYGNRHDLAPAALLRPDASTGEAIRVHLERETERRAIEATFSAAAPVHPPRWRPERGEAVVARFAGTAWYDAVVANVEESAVRVRWSGDRWPERSLPLAEVAPLPGDGARLEAGALVLVRPEHANGQWQPARVSAVDAAEVQVVTSSGEKRTVTRTDAIPFSARGAGEER